MSAQFGSLSSHSNSAPSESKYVSHSTWRSLNPIPEDNPLALRDFRSLDKEDLIACDRVVPTHAGEVYYLRYNPQQKWCWLEHMTPAEPLLFVLCDSAPGPQARYAYEVPI